MIKPVPTEKPRKSSLSSTEDQEVREMIDTSSEPKPALKKKPLTQIREEQEEEEECLRLAPPKGK